MADSLAEKINRTQNAFPPRPPGAVEPCPFAKPTVKENAPPVDVKTAFALTQYGGNPPLPTNAPEKAKEKKDWIEIILVDAEGQPMPNVRYRITAPDGKVQEGRLNEHGQAGLYQIESGNCKITFPDLDQDAWE